MKDQDLTFYLCTYHDASQLKICLKDLRKQHSSRVIVVSDGDDNPMIPKICQEFKAEFHQGEWLYGLEHGGQRHQRMLDLFLESPTPYLLKVDTDTKICDRIPKISNEYCCFGTIHSHHSHIIQGGCVGYALAVVQELYHNKLFLSSNLTRTETWQVAKTKPNNISEDQINAYCLNQINVDLINHPKILSLGRLQATKPPHRSEALAVVHPRSLVNFL